MRAHGQKFFAAFVEAMFQSDPFAEDASKTAP
jgi:hypothetical protein